MDVEGVLKDVGCIGTHRYPSGGCQIATESTHSLHHKHPSLGPTGRLLDLVTTLMGKFKWSILKRRDLRGWVFLEKALLMSYLCAFTRYIT